MSVSVQLDANFNCCHFGACNYHQAGKPRPQLAVATQIRFGDKNKNSEETKDRFGFSMGRGREIGGNEEFGPRLNLGFGGLYIDLKDFKLGKKVS